jgi:hypothetical protein
MILVLRRDGALSDADADDGRSLSRPLPGWSGLETVSRYAGYRGGYAVFAGGVVE